MRNYLRVRGEYEVKALLEQISKELPPRARRIPTPQKFLPAHQRNYLRVRGEYFMPSMVPAMCPELPPRARRILVS